METERTPDEGRAPITLAIAAEIRGARAAARLTQEEVAAKSGLPRSVYVRIEQAGRNPTLAQIAQIASALPGMTATLLVTRAEERLRLGLPEHGPRKRVRRAAEPRTEDEPAR